MSVEDVMSVNKLAQDLLDQGLVASREDAVKKAQGMLNKEIAGNDIKVEDTENKQTIVADNSIEKMKNTIQRTKDYNEKHFKHFKEHIEELYGEVRKLKEEIISLKAKGIAKTTQDSNLSEKKVEDACEAPKEEKKAEPHPKRGNATSEDVAIEKIFYFGNK